MTTTSGGRVLDIAAASSTEPALATTRMSGWLSSSWLRLSETSWWFSTMTTRIGGRWPLPPARVRGGARRALSWLIAGSGQLRPPYLKAGLQLLDDGLDLWPVFIAGQAQSLAEGPEPPADLLEAVDRGHVNDLNRRQRGQTLPPDLGPLPGLCPPAYRLDPAAPRSHATHNLTSRAQHSGPKKAARL